LNFVVRFRKPLAVSAQGGNNNLKKVFVLHRAPTQSEKVWKNLVNFCSGKKFFWSVSMEKENNLPDVIF